MEDRIRHQCIIYEGAPSEHIPAVAAELGLHLQANYRCLYLNSPAMVQGMRCSLAAHGFDLPVETGRGALDLTSDQAHLVQGTFDVQRMLKLLEQAIEQAIDDGYAGLWASGDMTWEFGGMVDLPKLVDYEQGLDALMLRKPALRGICQYHRDTLSLQAIKTGLRSHPATFVNDTLSRINLLYKSAS